MKKNWIVAIGIVITLSLIGYVLYIILSFAGLGSVSTQIGILLGVIISTASFIANLNDVVEFLNKLRTEDLEFLGIDVKDAPSEVERFWERFIRNRESEIIGEAKQRVPLAEASEFYRNFIAVNEEYVDVDFQIGKYPLLIFTFKNNSDADIALNKLEFHIERLSFERRTAILDPLQYYNPTGWPYHLKIDLLQDHQEIEVRIRDLQ